MKNQTLKSIPMQFVRDAVEETLLSNDKPVSLSLIIEQTLNSLGLEEESSETFTVFEDILTSMVEKGKAIVEEDLYSANIKNVQHKVIPENEPAVIKLPKGSSSQHLKGESIIFSIGSDYYPMAWSSIEDSESIQVSLIPESDNKYDSNAVAICVNDIIVGHLDRMMAKMFQPALLELYKKNIVATFDAMAQTSIQKHGYRFLSIAVPQPEVILEKAKRIK